MTSRIYSAGLFGIDGFEVTVECSAWDRIPSFDLVGLPDAAVKEAKNRVRSACENSGYMFPPLDLCVNLAPANLKKEGSGFDLAILISVLQCQGIIPHAMDFSDKLLIGELSLTGEVRRIDGVLPMCVAARDAGKKEIYVPIENTAEAAVVSGITVYGVKSLRALINHFLGKEPIAPTPTSSVFPPISTKQRTYIFMHRKELFPRTGLRQASLLPPRSSARLPGVPYAVISP